MDGNTVVSALTLATGGEWVQNSLLFAQRGHSARCTPLITGGLWALDTSSLSNGTLWAHRLPHPRSEKSQAEAHLTQPRGRAARGTRLPECGMCLCSVWLPHGVT